MLVRVSIKKTDLRHFGHDKGAWVVGVTATHLYAGHSLALQGPMSMAFHRHFSKVGVLAEEQAKQPKEEHWSLMMLGLSSRDLA